jgi:hypothetical protein
MPDSPSSAPRERNLLEAALYGTVVLAGLIAGTLAAVLALLWACGAPPALDPLLCLVGLLAGSGVLRFYAHLARTTP